MTVAKTVLVVAGAREAHEVVARLANDGQNTIAYLPEQERMFDPMPVPTRIGGLHTPTDVQAWMLQQHVDVVIDASHAFDTELSHQSRSAAEVLSLPYLRVLRPPWLAQAGDIWHDVPSVRVAALSCPDGSCVFSNTGWPSVPDYAGFKGRKLYLRQTHSPSGTSPYDFMTIIEGTPPFSIEQEVELFCSLAISHLICRNTGGPASQSKLLAARELGLPVFMVAREATDKTMPIVENAAAALAWSAGL